MQKIELREVQVGDYVKEYDDVVAEVHRDEDGLWIDWDSGDCGYVSNIECLVHVE